MYSVLAIVLSLILVIGIHEAGHAWVASLFHIKIKKISIGFGRPLLKWQGKSGCQWIWAIWPVGGYVELLNSRIEPVSPEESPFSFDKKPIWVRCLVLLSGALGNLLTAWLALVMILVLGYQQAPPVIDHITTPSTASLAGLSQGSQILSVAGKPVFSWRDVGMEFIMNLGHQDVSIVFINAKGIQHDAQLDLSKWYDEHGDKSLFSVFGITPDVSEKNTTEVAGLSWHKACGQALSQMVALLYFFLVLLKQLLSGVIPFALLLGPIGVFSEMVHSFSQGVTVFLYFIATLSLSVALVNLFPIPGLDGGSIFYSVIEKLRKKPVSVAMEVLLHRLFFIAFCIVLVQLLLNDLQRILHFID